MVGGPLTESAPQASASLVWKRYWRPASSRHTRASRPRTWWQRLQARAPTCTVAPLARQVEHARGAAALDELAHLDLARAAVAEVDLHVQRAEGLLRSLFGRSD